MTVDPLALRERAAWRPALVPPPSPREKPMYELHDYQKVAVQHLQQNPGAGLFLDMGLGKTAVALSALTPEHLPALVVAPKRVAEEVWPAEVPKWRPDLKIRVAAGRAENRKKILAQPADIHVISRDNFRDILAQPARWKTLIIDELSGFKNPKSLRWRAAKKIIRDVDHVWGLTGTPSPNGYLDLWSQIYLLDGGQRLGTKLTDYRRRYFTPGKQLANGVITSWDPRPGSQHRINTLIEDICLSMQTDGRIELPEVTINPVRIPLSPDVKRMYKKIKDDLVLDLSMVGEPREVVSASNAAHLSTRLAQITAGFLYHDERMDDTEWTHLHNEKVTAVREIVEGTGSPCLLFYRFRAEAQMMLKAMPELIHTIDEPGVIAAWNRGQIPILMAHPASIGHGLNLQDGGHTAIWSSLPWSLEEWDQSNKRLHRQGQKHPVVIHTLEVPSTVDGRIRQALMGKSSVQQALLDHLESPI